MIKQEVIKDVVKCRIFLHKFMIMPSNRLRNENQKILSKTRSYGALALSALLVLSLLASVQLANSSGAYAQESSDDQLTVSGICEDGGSFFWVARFFLDNLNPEAEYYFQVIYQGSVRQQGAFTDQESMPIPPTPIRKFDYPPNAQITLILYENKDLDSPALSSIEHNERVASVSVVCVDTAPPIIKVPADMTVEATSAEGAVVKYRVTAEDNVDGTVTLAEDGSVIQDKVGRDIAISCSPASGSSFKIGTTPVDCTATDASGNIRRASFSVTVNADTTDSIPPALSVPADMTVEATSAQGAVVNYKSSAQDSVDGSVEVSCSPASGSIFSIGTTTVQCTARDAAGNEGTASFKVTVRDSRPPVITVQDMTVEATSAQGAVVNYKSSAQDSVDGSVEVSCSPASGSTFKIGETKVQCTATDAAGNSAEKSFTIRVQDTTDPDVEITGAVDRTGREISREGTTPVPYIKITFDATDAVGIDKHKGTECSLDGQKFEFCASPKVYDKLSRGSHYIIVRATDAAGNIGEDKFEWIVGAPPSRIPEEEQSSSPALEKGQEEQAPGATTERTSTEDTEDTEDTDTGADTDRDATPEGTITVSQSQEPVEEGSEEGGEEENSTIGETS
jgi:predicted Rdx family selenoprotein